MILSFVSWDNSSSNNNNNSNKMKNLVVPQLLFLFLSSASSSSSPWIWTCDPLEKRCSRVRVSEATQPLDLMECKMTCSDQGLVWPLPTGPMVLSKQLVAFPDENGIALRNFATTANVEFLAKKFFTDVFVDYLIVMRDNRAKKGKDNKDLDLVTVSVEVQVQEDFSYLTLETDETYSLTASMTTANAIEVVIVAKTYQGMRHGLETLSQLISWNERLGVFQMHSSVEITDGPAYAYRGVSVDTSRNFMPVSVLKRMIDGFSYSKLNVFHWHLSDSQSFPLCLPSLPQLCEYGSYSEKMRLAFALFITYVHSIEF